MTKPSWSESRKRGLAQYALALPRRRLAPRTRGCNHRELPIASSCSDSRTSLRPTLSICSTSSDVKTETASPWFGEAVFSLFKCFRRELLRKAVPVGDVPVERLEGSARDVVVVQRRGDGVL